MKNKRQLFKKNFPLENGSKRFEMVQNGKTMFIYTLQNKY